ncbi:hypothetical protein ACTXT7_012385 [Hymenolepis weldensis]
MKSQRERINGDLYTWKFRGTRKVITMQNQLNFATRGTFDLPKARENTSAVYVPDEGAIIVGEAYKEGMNGSSEGRLWDLLWHIL